MTMSNRAEVKSMTGGRTRREAMAGAALVLGGLGLIGGSTRVWAADAEEISRTAEAIHQEPMFKASRKRVYEALTDSKQFDKIMQLSGAMQSMHLGDKPAEISKEAGGAFALFGGYITGRNIELVPSERVVQAWRAGNWAPGVYSIAKFELVEQGSGTKIVFDHTGFPNGDAEHLASGWKSNYWEPMGKLLI
jgi:activator of HSP90 ATPase